MKYPVTLLLALFVSIYASAQEDSYSIEHDSVSNVIYQSDSAYTFKVVVPNLDIYVVRYVVSSDRPTVGVGTAVMPFKKFQIETGGWYGSDVDSDYKLEQLGYNSTQLRYGIAQNAELRVSANFSQNTYTHEPTGLSSDDSGLSPLVVGTKIRLLKQNNRTWNNLTLMANVHLNQVASSVYQTPTVGHDLVLANNIQFSDKASLGSNFGLTWDGFGGSVTGLYTTAFSRKITGRMTAVGELYGYWPQGAGIDVSFDGGFTYLFNNQLQADVIGGFGISERAQDWFVGIGLCYLLNPKY